MVSRRVVPLRSGSGGEIAVLPHMVKAGPSRRKGDGSVYHYLIVVNEFRRFGGHLEAQCALLQCCGKICYGGGVGSDRAIRAYKSHQSLGAEHAAGVWVEGPSYPVGGADLGVPVGYVNAVIALVVVPMNERVQHW